MRHHSICKVIRQQTRPNSWKTYKKGSVLDSPFRVPPNTPAKFEVGGIGGEDNATFTESEESVSVNEEGAGCEDQASTAPSANDESQSTDGYDLTPLGSDVPPAVTNDPAPGRGFLLGALSVKFRESQPAPR